MASINSFWPPSGGGSSSNASVGSNGITAPASSTEVAGINPSGNLQPLQTTADGALIVANDPTAEQHVIVDSSALPTGAATQTTLATLSTTAASILLDMTNGTQITQITGTVPLPTGAATAANQSTEISSLTTIATNTTGASTAANQATEIASLATIATNTTGASTAANQATEIASLSQIATNTNNSTVVSGNLTALNQAVTMTSAIPYATTTINISGTWVGTLTFEGSFDGSTFATVAGYAYPGGVTQGSTSANGQFGVISAGLQAYRVRASAFTSGTIVVTLTGTTSVASVYVRNATASSLMTNAALVAGTNNVGYVAPQVPLLVADVVSAAIITTTTTAAFTPSGGSSYQVNIPVTAVTGTTPTLSVAIQESADTGTNWYTVYTFPTITATGSYNSPVLTLTGNRVRYVQTITGTTPSFTRAINRLQSSQQNFISPTATIFTDRSNTTSGTPSTSTQVAAANQVRRYFFIQNLSSSATIFINFTAAANTTSSIAILPFGSYVIESSSITTEAINVLSATASVPFASKEG